MASFFRSLSRLIIYLLLSVALLLVLLSGLTPPEVDATCGLSGSLYLSGLPWVRASTGWRAVGNDGLPTLDEAFAGGSIRLGGSIFSKGLGVYPLSEIVYELGGGNCLFQAMVGVDEATPTPVEGGRFLVFLDGNKAYDSGPLYREDGARKVELPLRAAKELRLVAASLSESENPVYMDWAEAQFSPLLSLPLPARLESLLSVMKRQGAVRKASAEAEQDWLESAHQEERAALLRLLGDLGGASGVRAAWDEGRQLLVLSNGSLALSLGFGGDRHGYLTLLDLRSDSLVVYNAVANLRTAKGKSYDLHTDTQPLSLGAFIFEDVSDPLLGPGRQVEATYYLKEENLRVTLRISLFEGAPRLLYQVILDGSPGLAISEAPTLYYFNPSTSHFVVGAGGEYITDYSRLVHQVLYDDGVSYRERVGLGKPVYLRIMGGSLGVIMGVIDESPTMARFSIELAPGRQVARVGMGGVPLLPAYAGSSRLLSPRLYLEVTRRGELREALGRYRGLMAYLYPSLPLPSWVKYQWLSWYAAYMNIDEEGIKQQIDFIAENLSDLGPWNVLVDAGWYVAEGRDGAEWRRVDEEKFPSGLRSLVDYAHSRGIKVVLYFSAPYIDSRVKEGDWLGLKGIIEKHSEWLISLGGDETRQSYAYDFSNPELRAYMQEVLRDYFLRYDVDGIKIDGLGNAEGAILDPHKLDFFGLLDAVSGQAMEIYRFIYENATALKEDVYIESGWFSPIFANQYAHTFRYGDEALAFRNRYPFPGLLEHVEYAAFQKEVLGQRANMGAIYDYPNTSKLNLWWLGAGLALGTQVALSFDLTAMEPEALSAYRSLLVHYNAFQGETFLSSALNPQAFATRVGDITYLGAINGGFGERRINLRLSRFGLSDSASYTVYDVEAGRYLRVQRSLRVTLPPQSFRLFLVRDEPGVFWTNSSFRRLPANIGLRLSVKGPTAIEGFMELFTPKPLGVSLDRRPLVSSEPAQLEEGRYAYDPNTGILTLRYEHKGGVEREIRIWY